jgi:hypothetical protein
MKSKFLKLVPFAGLFIMVTVVAANGHAQAQGSWTMKAPIPLARNEVALAAVGGKVHVIGGGVQNVAGTYHDEYDPATDRWRARAAAIRTRSYRRNGFKRQDLHRRGFHRFRP